MFGKKSATQIKKSDIDTTIKTIPVDFYAGANPVVEFKSVKKVVEVAEEEKLTNQEKQEFHKKTAHGLDRIWHPANLFTSRKFLLITGVSLFVLFIGVASLYYWYQAKSSSRPKVAVSQTETTKQSVANQTDSTVTTTSSVDAATSSASQTATSTLGSSQLQFPSILTGYGVDFDGDKLSDKEEEIFGTELAVVDTDKDDYSDGHEVYYLYNPAGQEPKRLIDSGKVKDFTNPVYKYKLYYPAGWTYGSVDSNYQDVLFTALNGESVEVKLFDFVGQSDFVSWFAQMINDEKYGLLQDFTSVFAEKAKMRNDKLVYYFTDDKYVYVIVYQVGAGNVANYQAVIEMMARSFRSSNNTFVKQWAATSVTATTTISVTSTLITTTTSSVTSTTSTAN